MQIPGGLTLPYDAILKQLLDFILNHFTFEASNRPVKHFRALLPAVSVALVAGFLFFLAGCTVFSGDCKSQEASSPYTLLAFEPGDVDALSIFTRQAVDGEVDECDDSSRHSHKLLTLSGILEHSRSLSEQVVQRQHQLLLRVPALSEHQAIRFSQLIIWCCAPLRGILPSVAGSRDGRPRTFFFPIHL